MEIAQKFAKDGVNEIEGKSAPVWLKNHDNGQSIFALSTYFQLS